MSNQRILGFDVARAFSILFIVAVYHVLGHAGLLGKSPVVRTFTYASLSVFTFISSFLLTSKYRFESKESIIDFYKKRLIRFYPLFFIASITLYFLGVNSGMNTLKGLLGISPYFKPHPITMWYCAMLISFYFFTPFLATGGMKKMVIKFLILMSLIIAIDLAFQSVVPRTYWYFIVYFSGIMVARYFGDTFLLFLKRYWVFFVFVFLLMIVLSSLTGSEILKFVNSGLGLFALLSLYLKIGDVCQNHEKWKKLFLFLSYSSMCMYLFHRQIFVLMLRIFHPASPYYVCLYLGIGGLILTVIVAYYLQLSYDILLARINR